MSFRVACLDVWSEAVRTEVRRVAPPEFELVFAQSYEAAHQRDLASCATFVVPGFAAVDRPLVDAAPRLRMVQKWGIGIDSIDQQALRERGIALAIASGCNAAPVAELAVALMLSVLRRLPYAQRTLRAGEWVTPQMRESCLQITGKTVGLVGFGHIGRMLARRLAGFDAHIVYFDPQRADAATEAALNARYLPLDELLAASDIVSLHLPLNAHTARFVDAAFIGRMKEGAVLINTARGGIVDESALLDALRSGKLRGAGLDAFAQEPPPADDPLLALEQVVATPHMGGGVFDNVAPVARHVFGNILRFARGEALPPGDLVLPGRAPEGART
jgi:phosphoglycerate dehydrogenase-like enzyme